MVIYLYGNFGILHSLWLDSLKSFKLKIRKKMKRKGRRKEKDREGKKTKEKGQVGQAQALI